MASNASILKGLLTQRTQDELASALGVSLRSVQNYLDGKPVSKKVARKIQELAESPVAVRDNPTTLLLRKTIQIEAMQKVQLTVLQELLAKALNIPNMEATAVIERALGQELEKLRQEVE